ncbi:MAG: HAD family hydrolase [Clostridiales bacterium]|nr:HAD family hydrolase [Clostridiales bacterium]
MTILFDLDGTLLPMDQNKFIEVYFGLLYGKMQSHGYQAHALIEAINLGTDAMINNDGKTSNEKRFWESFSSSLGQKVVEDKYLFEDFYRNEFQLAKSACGFHPGAQEVVTWLLERGHRLVLATNPVFPQIATYHRIHWAGLSPDDFELYTTYEDFHFCKPNLLYYNEIMEKINEKPENCIMIGNDVQEDLIAKKLRMNVFLLTDCLINDKNEDISLYPQGSFEELQAYLRKIV